MPYAIGRLCHNPPEAAQCACHFITNGLALRPWSLNPLRHIDLIGTIIARVLLAIVSSWAAEGSHRWAVQ
jgi:hypothetical protein